MHVMISTLAHDADDFIEPQKVTCIGLTRQIFLFETPKGRDYLRQLLIDGKVQI
jgi:hypothetical protein